MKAIFKNCTVSFKKALAPGTEVKINLNTATGALNGIESENPIGSGFYLGLDGTITYVAAYVGKETWCSDIMTIEPGEYSKIRFKNTKNRAVIQHRQVAFYSQEGTLLGKASIGGDSATSGAACELYDVEIPEGTCKIRFGSNSNGAGQRIATYEVYFVV